MKEVKYKSYDELPLMLSVPEVAAVLGISRAGAYELARSKGFPALNIGSRIVVQRTNSLPGLSRESQKISSFLPRSVVCIVATKGVDGDAKT